MQGTNADEAMKEIRLDADEGADILLVKPALPCLDLIRRAKAEFGSPLAAYQVSGEYAMIKAAAQRGMLDRSEEHTSELQSRLHLVCRLLLEKKKTKDIQAERRASSR